MVRNEPYLISCLPRLYFDHNGKLIRAVAYEPFREAMGLPQDGVIEQA